MAVIASTMTEERMEALAAKAADAYITKLDSVNNMDTETFLNFYLDVFEVALAKVRERENKNRNQQPTFETENAKNQISRLI